MSVDARCLALAVRMQIDGAVRETTSLSGSGGLDRKEERAPASSWGTNGGCQPHVTAHMKLHTIVVSHMVEKGKALGWSGSKDSFREVQTRPQDFSGKDYFPPSARLPFTTNKT